jgi:hypothetical protein
MKSRLDLCFVAQPRNRPRLHLAVLATMRPVLDPAGHRVPRTKLTCLLHTWRPHRERPFALVLHLHQHESSRNQHLQYLAMNQCTQRCQSLIAPGSDHPPILEPHMVLRGPGLGPPVTARLSLLRQQDHYPRGGVHCSLTSSLRMVVHFLTTISRRSPPFTWSSTCVVGCRSSSRPSLARCPVLSQLVASPTSFPQEELISASHNKSPLRTRSLCLA